MHIDLFISQDVLINLGCVVAGIIAIKAIVEIMKGKK